jgi:hypothetical protein
MEPTQDPSKLLQVLDATIKVAGKLARQRVDDLRRSNPHLSDAQLLKKLDKTFTTSVVTTGAATGALAAAPGVGTAVALIAATSDTSWFLTAAAGYVLGTAALRGVKVESYEHERALVLLVVAGGGGSTFFTKAAGRTGPHLGKIVANAIPMETIKGINKVLGRHFVTRTAGKRGVIKLGSTAPFGVGFAIGGGGNLIMAKGIIKTTKIMFDAADEFNAAERDEM